MKLGWTSTRDGLTQAQWKCAWQHLKRLTALVEVHHGDCVGGDDEFDSMLDVLAGQGLAPPLTIVHPCDIDKLRAHCDRRPNLVVSGRKVIVRPVKRPLVRNADIVAETDGLWAAPKTMSEERRSGTWATIRDARELGRPRRLFWPDGTTSLEVESR